MPAFMRARKIKHPKLSDAQRDILDNLQNPKNRRVAVTMGMQTGKTFLIGHIASLYNILKVGKDFNILVMSNETATPAFISGIANSAGLMSWKQRLAARIRVWLLRKRCKDIDATCFHANSLNKFRGRKFDLVLIDNAHFANAEVFTMARILTAEKGKILAVGYGTYVNEPFFDFYELSDARLMVPQPHHPFGFLMNRYQFLTMVRAVFVPIPDVSKKKEKIKLG